LPASGRWRSDLSRLLEPAFRFDAFQQAEQLAVLPHRLLGDRRRVTM
jgi:hypothetical protein